MEKWSIHQGNLMSVTARTHRLGLHLKSKEKQLLRNIAKKSVITNSKQLKPQAEEERPLFSRTVMATEIGIS